MNSLHKLSCFLFAVLFTYGCTPEVDVLAPAKEIRVVYGILNPVDTFQYIRVSRAFQTESDAIVYAGENDLSMPGLTVTLKSGDDHWVAEEVQDFPKDDGQFVNAQTIYRFRTDGSSATEQELEQGRSYLLEIKNSDSTEYLRAYTRIPLEPILRGDLDLEVSQGSDCCLPSVELDKEFRLQWKKDTDQVYYEIRAGMKWTRDGVLDSTQWRSHRTFGTDDLCRVENRLCKRFNEGQLIQAFSGRVNPQPGVTLRYDVSDDCVFNTNPNVPCAFASYLYDQLPQAAWMEVTAMSESLHLYLLANSPFVTELTGAKREYTNMVGNIDVYGIFAAIHSNRRYCRWSTCTEGHLQLNGRSFNNDCD
ncbi:MAG: DUF4249 family protein [Bacteroidota bacterium]